MNTIDLLRAAAAGRITHERTPHVIDWHFRIDGQPLDIDSSGTVVWNTHKRLLRIAELPSGSVPVEITDAGRAELEALELEETL